MSRYLMFALLLAAFLGLAEERAAAQGAAAAAKAKAKTEAVQARGETRQARTEKAQKPAAEQPKTEAATEPTEQPQAQTAATEETAEGAQPQTDEEGKLISVPGSKALGMSILGNQEAPKSLVIVPWKTSELGRSPGISAMLDDSRQPVDKEVFMRALRYYEIRSETKP